MHKKIFAVVMLVSESILAFSQANPAPIPENVKAHHKTLYSHYFSEMKNIDAETSAGRDVDVMAGHFVTLMLDPDGLDEARQNPYPDMSLRGISCDADAIVVAVPRSSETGVTADGNGLFTDYRFKLESVLKNTAGNQLENGGEIIVTRPGGQTTIHGRNAQVRIVNFPLFVIGHRYLLFLGHLRANDTFEAFGMGSFELTNGAVTPFHSGLSAIASLKTESSFLTEVRAAITAPCVNHPTLLEKAPEGL